jgi:DNA (cytosine-5)-methyltransferase 1
MGEVCNTVTSRWGTGGGNVPFALQAYSIREDAKANTFSATELEVSNSIGALRPSPQSHHAQTFIAIQDVNPRDKKQNGKGWNDEGLSYTVDTHATQGVARIVAPTLTASNDPSRSPQSTEVTNQIASVYAASMGVRRLTPTETERLQGFPDGYTQIPWKGKASPDSARYKAMGNSMAVPVMAWIGKRIQEVENENG